MTALFADVVGSTALSERLDSEEARLIINEAVACVIAAVERYGGTVKDLAGDGVFALFGAPVAHEDDAERALRAALEIIDAATDQADELKRGWGIEGFSMRVGIDTGEVVLGPVGGGDRVEYGAVGTAVNMAARLEAEAPPGGILASEATCRSVDGGFSWSEPMSLILKGSTEPVAARRLIASDDVSRLAGEQVAPMVGRELELAVGEEALAGLTRGQGSILFLSGDPGIGKSRLIAELRERAAAGKARWHEGRCVSYGESMPYWPYRDLLRDILGLGPRDAQMRLRVAVRRQLEALFGDQQAEVAPYVAALLGAPLEGDDGGRLEQLSPESRQFRTFEVMSDFVGRLAAAGPLVMVLEDLHWADRTSVQLTEHLLALPESLPLLLVISHRHERDHSSWALRETASREYPHLVREVELSPLSHSDQHLLLDALAGDEGMTAEVRASVLGYAEGNPFFVEQLVESVRERKAAPDGGEAGEERAFEVPPTIGELIIARADRLPEATRALLTAAAPLGRSFSVSLLQAVSDLGEEEVREALHQLQRLNLFQEERRWPEPEHRFKHALIQETLYRTLLTPRRRALHGRAAQWLEDRHGAHLEEVYALLAYHWQAAEDQERAITYLELAGDHSREQWAIDEAIGHYQALVKVLLAAGRRADATETLFKLGLALHTAMRYREANQVWERAFETRPADAAERPEPTALLRIAGFPIPISTDPHATIRWTDIQLGMQLNDRLVEAWPNFNIVPGLAERWEVADDGLRYTLRLRPDAAWNDGSPLQAADVERAIKRQLDPDAPGAGASIFFCLEGATAYFHRQQSDPGQVGVRALDERTIEFRLSTPAPYLMNVLNRPDANAAREGQPGSGPFRVERMEQSIVHLTRDPGYRGVRSGNVADIEWLLSDPLATATEFLEDRIDLVLVRSGRIPPGLEQDAGGVAARLPATTSVFVVFDCRKGLGADLHLRRALSIATEHARLKELPGIAGTPATGGIVPPALQGHTPDIAPRFDAEAARAELSQATVEGRFRLGTLESWKEVAEVVVAGWRETLGVEVELELHDHATAAFAAGCDAMVYNWLPGYPDADYYLRLLLHSQSISNFAGWANPDFDRLIDEARLKTAAGARLALFHEADKLAVHDHCVLIPLLYYRPFVLAKPWVHGYWEWGKSGASFGDLVVDETSPRHRGRQQAAAATPAPG